MTKTKSKKKVAVAKDATTTVRAKNAQGEGRNDRPASMTEEDRVARRLGLMATTKADVAYIINAHNGEYASRIAEAILVGLARLGYKLIPPPTISQTAEEAVAGVVLFGYVDGGALPITVKAERKKC